MALCEHCRAELEGTSERLPEPWFDHEARAIAGATVILKVWELCSILYRRRDRVVSTDSLMTLLYANKPDDPPDDKIIDVYICRLRVALDPTPYSIRTDWGCGYQFILGKQPAEPVIGEVETDVPPPPRERILDKYGLAVLKPGQSRRVDNAKLATLHAACAAAKKRQLGRFTAGLDDQNHLRIWRVE